MLSVVAGTRVARRVAQGRRLAVVAALWLCVSVRHETIDPRQTDGYHDSSRHKGLGWVWRRHQYVVRLTLSAMLPCSTAMR